MNTSAGNALYQRKPTAAPISAAPMIARSSLVRLRWAGFELERTYETTIIAVYVNKRDDSGAGGEPVDAVGEVRRVRRAGDDHEEERVPP